ncbi:MAG: 3-isopropylmalate dehydrogenase [Clostridia bacterium]|nr:3-isopropylmalate dehydrogenase [Clostridia bacterium]
MTQEKVYKIALIPGDGIGPDIVTAACEVLDKAAGRFGFRLEYEELLAGGAALDASGEPLPQYTVEAAKGADAVLLGAVGGPKWDTLPTALRPEKALLGLRSSLGLFANLRPARMFPALVAQSPLRPEITAQGMDIMIVRELTGGIYFGEQGRSGRGEERKAYDTEAYSYPEIVRIARIAFGLAQGRNKQLTLVDKANILTTSQLWREVVKEIAPEYPDVQLDYLYVDNAAMQLVKRPYSFDVILTSNMFGDILSDEAAQITGSIGLLPSASLGLPGKPGMYEPIHGSAPDIAGQNKANPLATILSAAMLLRLSLGEEDAAAAIEDAVTKVLADGYRSPDLLAPGETAQEGMLLGTLEMTSAVLAAL